MNGCVPQNLNGAAPQRQSIINVSHVTYTSLGSNINEAYVTDRGSPGDPATGGNQIIVRQGPVTGAPLDVYFGGLRMNLGLDYTVNSQVITFISSTFNSGNVIAVSYWVSGL